MIARFREERAADAGRAGRGAARPHDRRRRGAPCSSPAWPSASRSSACTCSPTRCCRRWRSAACSPSRRPRWSASRSSRRSSPSATGASPRAGGSPQRRPAARGSRRSRSAARPRSRVTVAAGLIALSVPAFGIEVANADATSLPETRAGAARPGAARAQLQHGRRGADHRALRAPADGRAAAAHDQAAQRGRDPADRRRCRRPSRATRSTRWAATTATARSSSCATSAPSTPSLLVGGPAAELIDAKDSTRERLPLALAVVFLPTALLLFALTRSRARPAEGDRA